MSDDDLTPGQHARAEKLTRLAEEEFGWNGLSDAERRVIRCAAIGEVADFSDLDPEYPEKLQKAIEAESEAMREGKKLPDRPVPPAEISPEVLRWLLTASEAKPLIHAYGVRARYIHVEKTLKLARTTLGTQFYFGFSAFEGGLDLTETFAQSVALSGARLGAGRMSTGGYESLSLDGSIIRNELFLQNGFLAEGEISLIGAEIRGDLTCSGGRIRNTGGDTLSADGARIGRNVYLNNGFTSEGEVRLLGATIGGSVFCTGGRLRNAGRDALSADGARIEGGLFLNSGFESEGKIRLLGATIGGCVECTGGRLRNAGGDALSASEARIGGGVYLNSGFESEGEVRLLGATIGGCVECTGGRVRNAGGDALSADRVRIGGDLFLRGGFASEGRIRLLGATIEGDLACIGGRLTDERGYALSLRGGTVKGDLILAAIESIEGAIDLRQSEIGVLSDATSPNFERWAGWPEKLLLAGCQYHAIDADSPLDAKSRLAWLDRQDASQKGDIPNPQPYRWLADVMKKQGYEDEARTVLRVCAERRMWKLARRAYREGVTQPVRYLLLLALVFVVLIGLFLLGGHSVIAITLAGVTVLGATAAIVCKKYGWMQQLTGAMEFARIGFTQLLYQIVVGHGYARWRAAIVAGVLVISGTILFNYKSVVHFQPSQAVALKAYQSPADPDNGWVTTYPEFDPIIYSADTLIPLVSLQQENLWTPSGQGRWGWFIKNVYLPFHIGAGWVVATLFVASFTRLMRQEG